MFLHRAQPRSFNQFKGDIGRAIVCSATRTASLAIQIPHFQLFSRITTIYCAPERYDVMFVFAQHAEIEVWEMYSA